MMGLPGRKRTPDDILSHVDAMHQHADGWTPGNSKDLAYDVVKTKAGIIGK